MQDILLIGSGGTAREVLQIVHSINTKSPTWNLLGFLDQNPDRHGHEIQGLEVLGGVDWLRNHPDTQAVVAIGGTPAKHKVVQQATEAGARFTTLIHPNAWIGRNVRIGEGSIVCAGVSITTDVEIGRHVILNLSVTVGHDVALGDYVTVAPAVNISGAVTVGPGCDLGTNATIIQGKTIGEWTIIGAGSVVVKDVPANVTAVGNPCRAIKERPSGWHTA